MPKLFEDFVTVALREALETEFGGRVDGRARHYLDQAGKVVLRPDIVWKIRGSPVAVIDAKYKSEWSRTKRRAPPRTPAADRELPSWVSTSGRPPESFTMGAGYGTPIAPSGGQLGLGG
jgi:hypothetical protein